MTNDDGIKSPGLWAAAAELSKIGYVTVAAPREQSTGMGRSLPSASDGIIKKEKVQVNGQEWTVYAVGGSPAQAVLHALYEIMETKPDLVVSGINYGENVGMGVTISGTVGAAMEAAAHGIPSLAVSQQTEVHHQLSHSTEIDFSTAAIFTARFARLILERAFPAEVDLIKLEIPAEATSETEWRVGRLTSNRYYEPVPAKRASWDEPGPLAYQHAEGIEQDPEDTDAYILRQLKMVAVTPLSLDMTSRVDFSALKNFYS